MADGETKRRGEFRLVTNLLCEYMYMLFFFNAVGIFQGCH